MAKSKRKKTKKKGQNKVKRVSFKYSKKNINLRKIDKLRKLANKQLKEVEEELDLRDIGKNLNKVGLYLAEQEKIHQKYERQIKEDRRRAQLNPDGLLNGGRKRKRTRKRRKKRKRRR